MRFLLLAFAFLSFQANALVVVELFTSEGCSSCPPAERYLETLVDNKDLLPLSFHVDYWDKLGWKDPYAHPDFTQRQYDYSNRIAKQPGFVYTPQFLVGGNLVGTSPYTMMMPRLFKKAQQTRTIPVTLTQKEDGSVHVEIQWKIDQPATLWLIGYDHQAESHVKAGENSGKRLQHHNIVRKIVEATSWQNEREFTFRKEQTPQTDALAVIVQELGPGRILAAGKLEIN